MTNRDAFNRPTKQPEFIFAQDIRAYVSMIACYFREVKIPTMTVGTYKLERER